MITGHDNVLKEWHDDKTENGWYLLRRAEQEELIYRVGI